MTSTHAIVRNVLRTFGTLLLFASPCLAVGIGASATYTAVSDPNMAGLYDYTLTLNNTGTTTIGTFWFAWVPGAGFLSPTPTGITSPAGWTFAQTNAGAGIRWVTPTSLLASGQSLTGFSFVSAETPAQLLLNYTGTGAGAGLPVVTSVVYAGVPLSGPSAQFVPTAATPEPGSVLLVLTGLTAFAGSIGAQRRRRADKASAQAIS